MNFNGRIGKLRELLAEKGLDGLLVSSPHNRFYLSGFNGSDGYLLITRDKAVIAVDFRYTEQAARQCPDYEVFRVVNEMAEWFPRLVNGLGLRNLGFEPDNVSFSFHGKLVDIINKQQLGLRLLPAEKLVESLRDVKDPDEIKLITAAIDITDRALDHINSFLRQGVTELQVAWEIEKFMRENGSETMPFEVIVAAGPNGALPHHHPSDYAMKDGEPVVIDIGARCGGYTSDLTRTLAVGKTDATFKKVYDTVLGAQLAAIAIIKEGITGEQADSLGRIVIDEAGYGEKFGHSLGHGIGLETHESPRLGPRSAGILKDGMVFTIEPGIYISGWGGIRIEDDVMLENGKIRVLSKASK